MTPTFPAILAAAGASAPALERGSWGLLALYFVVAIAVSFFCSVWEAVLLSITRPYVAAKKESHPAVGHLLERLKADLNAPLTSILTLNTIAHTVGAMGVGAQVAVLVGGGWVETMAGALMTLAILILSEIIPKNLGARHWRSWAPWVARCLSVITRVMMPFVKLVALFAPGGHARSEFSREELHVMAKIGRNAGQLEENELRVLQNLLNLRNFAVRDVMTPRTVVFALPQTTTVREFVAAHVKTPFSRIPIYADNIDEIQGFVLKSDLLAAAATERPHPESPLTAFLRPSPMLPSSTSITEAFEQLLAKQDHIAVAIDEFGGFDGIVTIEDIVETLLGLEIIDEVDVTADMQKRARALARRRAARAGNTVLTTTGGRGREPAAPARVEGGQAD